MELSYSCDPASADNKFTIAVEEQKLPGNVVATRDWDDFVTVNVGSVKLERPGPVTNSVIPAGPSITGGGLMNLRTMVLKPVGTSK